jgi:hypothetical protein
MDPLSRLFGSYVRLKLLRLFLFNDDLSFTLPDAAFRAKASKDSVRKELNVLVASGVVRKKTGKGPTQYCASRKFPYYDALQAFIRSTTSLNDADMVGTIRRAGNVRLVVLSGLFTGAIETKADLLIVGDKLDDRALDTAVRSLEAELGRELRFASFTSEDFRYRRGVYDRLLRDIFDFPHRILLDRIGVVQQQ